MISILGSQPLPTLEIGPPPQASMERLAYITELSQHLANAPSLLLNSLHPVFPLRGFEEWGYPVPDNAANSLDRVTLADRAIALTSILGYNRDLEEELSERLEDLFGIRIKFKLVPSKRGAIWAGGSEGRSRDTLFANKGTGANQVPFILVPIGLARPNETILLSKPRGASSPQGAIRTRLSVVEGREETKLTVFYRNAQRTRPT